MDVEKRGEEDRDITYELDRVELAERADRMAQNERSIEDLRSEKKRIAGQFKEKITNLEQERSKLATVIREGTERREVRCVVLYNYTEGRRIVVPESRTALKDGEWLWDEEAIVEQRPLSADERQRQREMQLGVDPTHGIGSEQDDDDEEELEEAEVEDDDDAGSSVAGEELEDDPD